MPFGDVGSYGDGGAPSLQRHAKLFLTGKLIGDSVDQYAYLSGFFPYL